ncbi:MAG: sigma-54 dependent transcriptional regulator [Acidobacteria bacterium]|nr:sigma-54 dependent transcriptional regulator [Acidobacteriota bacterium]
MPLPLIKYPPSEGGAPAYGLVGDSPRMQGVLRIIGKLSNDTSPVLITGESGTAKELVARAVHRVSPLAAKKLVPVDSATLVGSLMESELFGHMKGAFTGAIDNKLGLVRAAAGGTLFLDEIGELNLETQAKLLRLLQEGEIRPIGATDPIRVDVRVVAATNRNLEEAVRQKHFREDLYYRLKVITIRVPALRDRPTDILPLAWHFIAKHAVHAVHLSEAVEKELTEYAWPGNVRELENTIRQIVVLNSNPLVEPKDLPSNLRNARIVGGGANGHSAGILPLEELERRHIMETVEYAKGDITHAATVLGISKATIRRKLKKYEDQGRGWGDPQGLLPF